MERKAYLIFSEFEPYRKYIRLLIEALRKFEVEAETESVEGLVLGAFGKEKKCLIVPCTNFPQIAVILSFFAGLGYEVLNSGISDLASNRININISVRKLGVPVPNFWVSINASKLLSFVPDTAYPIIMKSIMLHKQDSHIFRSSEELRYYITSKYQELRTSDSLIYVEEYIESREYTKLYFCNSKTSLYKKFVDFTKKPEAIPSHNTFESAAHLIYEKLCLDFFSLDIIESKGSYLVIDVNTYPIFKYHPAAYDWLAETIHKRLTGENTKED